MSTQTIRIGVPQIFLSYNSSVAVPSLSTLVFGVSSITPTDSLLNDINQPLSTSDTYKVMIGLVGRDATNGGYTVSYCSPESSSQTITSNGQGLYIRVANAAWPANFDTAVCAVIFLKINSAQYQLAEFAYIDPTGDFNHTIMVKPLRVAPRFQTALLQSTTSDQILGNRTPLGISLAEITPTTGEFNFRRPVTNVTVSPNNAPDFQVATSRASGISFQALLNDIKTFVSAAAGIYVTYTDYLGGTVQEAQLSLQTAQAILRENRAVQVFLPPDHNGNQEVRLLVGLLTFNQQELNEAWSKNATTPVNFVFDAASLDRLIPNTHTEIQYILNGA